MSLGRMVRLVMLREGVCEKAEGCGVVIEENA